MRTRKRIHVYRNGNFWKVSEEGRERQGRIFLTSREALRRAESFAKRYSVEVVFHQSGNPTDLGKELAPSKPVPTTNKSA